MLSQSSAVHEAPHQKADYPERFDEATRRIVATFVKGEHVDDLLTTILVQEEKREGGQRQASRGPEAHQERVKTIQLRAGTQVSFTMPSSRCFFA